MAQMFAFCVGAKADHCSNTLVFAKKKCRVIQGSAAIEQMQEHNACNYCVSEDYHTINTMTVAKTTMQCMTTIQIHASVTESGLHSYFSA